MVMIRLCAERGCPNPAVHGAFCYLCQRQRVPRDVLGTIAWDAPWDDEPEDAA